MRENFIQRTLMKKAREANLSAWKNDQGIYSSGWPDVVVMGNRRILFAECKAPNRHPTPKQWVRIHTIINHGFAVYVIRLPSEAEALIRFFNELSSSVQCQVPFQFASR